MTEFEYDQIADEYYNSDLHPTCANFRELGLRGLRESQETLNRYGLVCDLKILETGAGKSSVAESFSDLSIDIRNLTIQDKSEKMLLHSERWKNQISDSFISDARDMPIESASFDCIFSFLLDPYDTPELWAEVSRISKPRAQWIITSPNHSWASRFRNLKGRRTSRFVNITGQNVDLPSFTYSVQNRIRNLSKFGWTLDFFKTYDIIDLSLKVSPKLIHNYKKSPVLDFFIFHRDSD